jgi:nucleoside-diphosphate-sugar epimerase
MKKAIVLGATGYVGSRLVIKLIENNIEVLAVGRKSFELASEVLPLDSSKITYIQLEAKDIYELLKMKIWVCEKETVLYNFTWSGIERLTDGNISDQLKNIALSSDAVKVSKKLGCSKYINVGSEEESFFEYYLKNDWNKIPCTLNSISYSGAKLINRDMTMLIAYLERIDYVNTRFSVVIDRLLTGKGYIADSFKKMRDGKDIAPIKNKQLYDIIDLDELANAYVAIGYYGKNKSNYYIGTGSPMTLSEYFSLFLKRKNNSKFNIDNISMDKIKSSSFFNTRLLYRETGFKAQKKLKDIFDGIIEK